MSTAPPGGTKDVRFDELPLVRLDISGVPAGGTAPPGGTAAVRFDVIPPLLFDFPYTPALPTTGPQVSTPTAASPRPVARQLAVTGWAPPGISVLALAGAWVLRRRLQRET